jgi:hypothetical protein
MKRVGKIAKKALGAAYKAKTAPLQVASKVAKTVAPRTKLAKGLDKIADPAIFKGTGGAANKLKNPKKADLNKDGKLSSYEEKRGMAIEKAMRKQNRVKLKNGGFIARGCGAIRKDKRKVTTMS